MENKKEVQGVEPSDDLEQLTKLLTAHIEAFGRGTFETSLALLGFNFMAALVKCDVEFDSKGSGTAPKPAANAPLLPAVLVALRAANSEAHIGAMAVCKMAPKDCQNPQRVRLKEIDLDTSGDTITVDVTLVYKCVESGS